VEVLDAVVGYVYKSRAYPLPSTDHKM
jgi:hypothetical protein